MTLILSSRAPIRLLASLLVLSAVSACGAEGGGVQADAGADAQVQPDAALVGEDAAVKMDSGGLDVAPPDAQATMDLEATTAFAEIAGTYNAKAANVSGTGAAAFDDGAPYNFSITADGTVSIDTKGSPEVFSWASHGKSIRRNSQNKVTTIELEDAGKRILNVTYVNGTIFDVAGVYVDPLGRWYLTSIKKN